MAKGLLAEISIQAKLQHYAIPGLFAPNFGFLAGIFNGYFTSVGLIDGGRNVAFAFIAAALTNGADLKKAVNGNLTLKQLKGRFEVKTVDDAVIIRWPRLTAPDADEVVKAMSAVAMELSGHMQPWKGLCLKCNKQPSDQLCLLGLAPSILCNDCLARLPETKMLKEHEFAEKEPRRYRGLLFAAAAAALFVLIYASVIGWMGATGKYSVKLDLIVGLAAAAISVKAYEAGAEKLDRFGRYAGAGLGIVVRFCCGVAFFSAYYTHHLRVPLTINLVAFIAGRLPQLAAGQFGGAALFYVSLALPLCVLAEKGTKGNFQHLEARIVGKVTESSGASA